MSLSTNVTDLATTVGTELKKTRVLLNNNAIDLNALTTTPKTDLVAALNWLHAEVQSLSGGAAGINDSATSTSTTWSSSKIDGEIDAAVAALVDGAPLALDTLKELADALADGQADIGGILTALDNRVRFDAAQSLTGPQQAQARANIGAGTSNLTLGTTSSTAKAGDWMPTWANVSGKPASFTPSSHQHPVSEVSDSTAVGQALVTAADAASARTAIGAGTSNLSLGTTASTAKAGNWVPAASDISDATAAGRAILTAASAAAVLTLIGAAAAADVGSTTVNYAAQFEAALV